MSLLKTPDPRKYQPLAGFTVIDLRNLSVDTRTGFSLASGASTPHIDVVMQPGRDYIITSGGQKITAAITLRGGGRMILLHDVWLEPTLGQSTYDTVNKTTWSAGNIRVEPAAGMENIYVVSSYLNLHGGDADHIYLSSSPALPNMGVYLVNSRLVGHRMIKPLDGRPYPEIHADFFQNQGNGFKIRAFGLELCTLEHQAELFGTNTTCPGIDDHFAHKVNVGLGSSSANPAIYPPLPSGQQLFIAAGWNTSANRANTWMKDLYLHDGSNFWTGGFCGPQNYSDVAPGPIVKSAPPSGDFCPVSQALSKQLPW